MFLLFRCYRIGVSYKTPTENPLLRTWNFQVGVFVFQQRLDVLQNYMLINSKYIERIIRGMSEPQIIKF